MKKKVLIGAIVLILALCTLGIYLNQVYLPVKIKSLVIEGIESRTGRKAHVGSVRLNILKGIVLEDLSIFDQTPHTDRTFLEVKQISLGWLFLPLLKKRQFIIPFINIYSPKITLRRGPDNTFNIPRFRQSAKDNQKKRISLIVYKVNINNAEVNFIDEAVNPTYSQKASLNIVLSYVFPQKIKYSLTGDITVVDEADLDADKSPIAVQSKGEFDLVKKQLIAPFEFKNISLLSISAYCKAQPTIGKDTPFILNEGRIEKIKGEVLVKDNILRVSLDTEIPFLSMQKEEIIFSGPLKLGGSASYNIKTKAKDYSLNLSLDKALLSGLPYIEEAKDLSGKFYFSPDEIKTSNLSGKTIGALFKVSARLIDFNNPQLSARVSSDKVSFGKIKDLLKEANIADFPVEVEGGGKLTLDINSQILAPRDLQLKGEIILENNKIKLLGPNQTVDDINGIVLFDKDGVSWQGLSAVFRKIKYTSSGRVLGFIDPEVDFNLFSSGLTLEAAARWKDKILEIKSLKGKYLHSEFNIVGSTILGGDSPQVNIKSRLTLELKDLRGLSSDYLPAYLPVLNKIDAEGTCDIRLSVSGRLRQIRGLNLSLDLESPAITAELADCDFKLNNSRLHLRQNNMKIPVFEFLSDCYSGKINLNGNADLSYSQPKFECELALVDIDLGVLRLDTPLKDKNLSGLVSVDLILNGQGKDTANLTGEGRIFIKEGNFWEFAPFKKFGQFLFIPSFGKIVFNEAEADLLIKQGNIFTDQLVLKSPQLNLYGQGKIDFKGNLDYTIKSEFDKEVSRGSSDLMQILSSVIDKAKKFITLKLTGTINNPKFKIVPVAFESFKELEPLKELKERIKEIFE